MITQPNLVADYDAIIQVLGTYEEGARTGKGEVMKPAFHEDATIFAYVGEELAFKGAIQSLFDWNDKNGPAKDIKARVTSVEIVGQVAYARVEAENWTGLRFTDLLLMIKRDGKWKVQNKVFHLHTA